MFRLAIPIGVLIFVACAAVASPSFASDIGVRITRIDVTLEIPDPERDPKLLTRHTVVVYAQSSFQGSKLSLPIGPAVVTASELGTGSMISTTRRTTDDGPFTDITLPIGESQVKLVFSQPLFDGALPRFWWDETQVLLLWPCAPTSTATTSHGVAVTSLTPLSFGRPPGFACVNEAGRMKCTRYFGPPELARCKTSYRDALVVAEVPETSLMPMLVSGGQIAGWCLLLLVAAAFRLTRRNAPVGKARIGLLLRTALALALLPASLVGYALMVDGDGEGPLAKAMTWACVVYGVTALILAQVHNPDHPIRTKLGQLAIVVAMPASVGIMAVSSNPELPLWFAGGAAAVAIALMYHRPGED